MKRILSLVMGLSLAASQVFSSVDLTSLNKDTLKTVEKYSAAGAVAGAVVDFAVDANDVSPIFKDAVGLSSDVNKLVSYALQDQSVSMKAARILERLSKNADWKNENLDLEFLKKFSTELAHGISLEVAMALKGKAVDGVLAKTSDSRVVSRIADTVATAVAASLVEAAFANIEKALELKHNGASYASLNAEVLLSTFVATLASEAAWNLAGELILVNIANAKAEHLSDIIKLK